MLGELTEFGLFFLYLHNFFYCVNQTIATRFFGSDSRIFLLQLNTEL